ncbi:Clp protease N-terminal domain-containing protein [Streptomyces sp. AC627_RSS907]|uniref:Clp protease N-terminal domain-containing protein n=1 Tax=Streptomyces sp. AC627_RSS907 TaxID=2823684 RepID=UPI001C2510F6|nr:Clp protease N-terminal domain-containing protein [Streptomyces sp. AC627_RSS907]
MEQRGAMGAHAGAMAGVTTEFEPDVMDLLVQTMRRADRSGLPAVGTDTLLGELVMGDTDAGAAIAPGMRKAGSLSGRIRGHAGEGWARDDEVHGAPVVADRQVDEAEVDAAWREAWWRHGLGRRGPAPESGRVPPRMTGAMRACLLLALRAARAEGTVSVRCRHVARALLEVPDSRAGEALLLERLDPAAAATALDRLDAAAPAETEGVESRGVTLLRRAGTLGKSGNRLTRALTSWTSGAGLDGSPFLFAVSVEAVRQAVRCGRLAAEPVDLLLGILALDRALYVAGRSLPASLADANAAPELLRRHGVRQDALVSAAAAIPSAGIPGAPGGDDGGDAGDGDDDPSPLTAAADRIKAVARLTAAEHGSPTVGTVHLLSALLDEPAPDGDAGSGGTVVRLLAAEQVDVAALRAEPALRAAV